MSTVKPALKKNARSALKRDFDENNFSERQQTVMRVFGHILSRTFQSDSDRANIANRNITYTLYRHLLEGASDLPIPQADMNPTLKQQMRVLSGFINLCSMKTTIRTCEYYFKCYPFSGLPISRADHLRNICEMFFDRIVQFRDRLKATLNAIKNCSTSVEIPVGKLIKAFDRTFDSVIRLRNQVHHNERYNDHLIEQLSLIDLFSHVDTSELPLPDEKILFRRAAKTWSKHVQNYSASIAVWCDTVAGLILDHCSFAKEALSTINAKTEQAA